MTKFKRATDTLREVFIYYIVVMFISALLFHLLESVSIGDALYWAGVTMTTVGYGDISPHTVLGKLLSVIIANISIFLLAPLIVVRMIEHLVEDRDHFSHDEQEELKQRLISLEQLLKNEIEKKG